MTTFDEEMMSRGLPGLREQARSLLEKDECCMKDVFGHRCKDCVVSIVYGRVVLCRSDKRLHAAERFLKTMGGNEEGFCKSIW
jgi:hypothetical protein